MLNHIQAAAAAKRGKWRIAAMLEPISSGRRRIERACYRFKLVACLGVYRVVTRKRVGDGNVEQTVLNLELRLSGCLSAGSDDLVRRSSIGLITLFAPHLEYFYILNTLYITCFPISSFALSI